MMGRIISRVSLRAIPGQTPGDNPAVAPRRLAKSAVPA